MTAPSTPPAGGAEHGVTATPSAPLPAHSVNAVQQALGTEHAAVWVYGLCTAFVSSSAAGTVATDLLAHRQLRDTVNDVLTMAGADPVAAAAAYTTPKPVTDSTSALAALIAAETDCAAAWHSVLERSSDAAVRTLGLRGLTEAATYATHWRQLAGIIPSAPALPGQR